MSVDECERDRADGQIFYFIGNYSVKNGRILLRNSVVLVNI